MKQPLTTFIFDKGQLKVILLPEEPKELKQTRAFSGYPNIPEWLKRLDRLEKEYNEAVAYARAHPVDVRGEDVEQIRKHIWSVSDLDKVIEYCDWVPQDNTEYKLEGVRMEIKEEKFTMPKTTIRGQHEVIERGGQVVVKQVACLIEDDKQ